MHTSKSKSSWQLDARDRWKFGNRKIDLDIWLNRHGSLCECTLYNVRCRNRFESINSPICRVGSEHMYDVCKYFPKQSINAVWLYTKPYAVPQNNIYRRLLFIKYRNYRKQISVFSVGNCVGRNVNIIRREARVTRFEEFSEVGHVSVLFYNQIHQIEMLRVR